MDYKMSRFQDALSHGNTIQQNKNTILNNTKKFNKPFINFQTQLKTIK